MSLLWATGGDRRSTLVLMVLAINACAARPGAPGGPRLGTSDPCVRAAGADARIHRGGPRNYEQAKEAFDRGLRRKSAGEYGDALALFQVAVAADPTFGLAHLEAAVSHLYTDNDTDALRKHLAAAVVLLPRNPRAQLQFARFKQETGDAAAAEQHLMCAIDLAPSYADAHETLARLLLGQGRPAEAERSARSAVALAPSKVTYRVLLADILSERARWREAGVEVEEAAKRAGRSAVLYRRAAELYAKGGAPAEARRLRAIADRIDPPPKPRNLRPLPRR